MPTGRGPGLHWRPADGAGQGFLVVVVAAPVAGLAVVAVVAVAVVGAPGAGAGAAAGAGAGVGGGIFRRWPSAILSGFSRLFSVTIAATEVPNCLAIFDSVSPFCTM